jgi:hypothetical protein
VELRKLDGKKVLVKSSLDHRDPPAVYHGSIEVRDAMGDQDGPAVAIILEPESTVTPIRAHPIVLDTEELARLFAAKGEDLPEITVHQALGK